MDPLARDLCRLARRLETADVELFLVGGYGLVRKAQAIHDLDVETVAPNPFPRATEDLEVLLTAEIVLGDQDLHAPETEAVAIIVARGGGSDEPRQQPSTSTSSEKRSTWNPSTRLNRSSRL